MYSAEELIWATQLAYCNFTNLHAKEHLTVQEILATEGNSIFYDPKLNDPAAGDTRTMREDTKQFIKDVADGKICQGWKVIDVRNEESVNIEQDIKDWVQADMTIMNGDMTEQELAA